MGEREADDVQAVGRLTYLAEAEKLEDAAAIEAAAERYYRYFPDSANYHKAHDFDFWVLAGAPPLYRWVWRDPLGRPVDLGQPFAGKAERSMIEHMNSDHTKAIAHYVELGGLPATESAQLVGIDSEGMHLRIGQSLHWLGFAEPCNTPTQVREALVSLAHAEVWPKTVATA